MKYSFVIAFLLLQGAMLLCQEPPCENFEPGTFSKTQIQNEFKGAVFRIQISDSSGTAYLIDSLNGYFLTANHVITDASDRSASISATTPAYPGKVFKLKLVRDLSQQEIDLALLQLATKDDLSTIRPLDVSLRVPNPDTTLFSIGYPAIGDEPNANQVYPDAKYNRITDGLIEVAMSEAFPGTSGAPLVDGAGAVLGTCAKNLGVDGTVGRFVPMVDAESLLNLVPLTKRVEVIDQQLRDGMITQSELAIKLRKSTTTASNIELYSWGRIVASSLNKYSARKPYF